MTNANVACPRCNVPLVAAATTGATLLGCGACGGIWLDNTSAHKVLTSYDAAALDLAARAELNQQKPDVRPALRCPACAAALARRTTYGVEIDACAAHGTWFDSGELRFLLEGLRPPPAPRAAPVAAAPARAPVFTDSSSSSSVDWGDVGANVVGGAFSILLDVILDD